MGGVVVMMVARARARDGSRVLVVLGYEELIHISESHEPMPRTPPLQTQVLGQLLRTGCGHDDRQDPVEREQHVRIYHVP